jgi:predicted aspartyl protease
VQGKACQPQPTIAWSDVEMGGVESIMRGAAWALLAVATALAPMAARADCKLSQLAEFHVDPSSRVPVVDGQINGAPVKIMFDTGSSFSMIYRHEAQRLGLPLTRVPGMEAEGLGGETDMYQAHINELQIGGSTKQNFDLLVSGDQDSSRGVDMILGNDFFSEVDAEFDLPDGVVRLFQPKGCTPPQLVYWGAPSYSQATLLPWPRDWPAPNIMAVLNGQPVRARLDTGAYTSLVDSGKAAFLGVTKLDAAGRELRGNGPRRSESWVGQFNSIAIGDEQISHVRLQIADMINLSQSTDTGTRLVDRGVDSPAMLIGADFFHSHRVFVDYGDHMVLFSYQGGPVFQPVLGDRGH